MIKIIHQRPHLACQDCQSGKHSRKRCRLLDKYSDDRPLPQSRRLTVRGKGVGGTLPARRKLKASDCTPEDEHVEQYLTQAPVCPSYIAVNFYPCEDSPEVKPAMQYYFEVFAYSVHPQKQVPLGWKPKDDFFDKRFQTTMADPMWFHANLAFAEAMKSMTLFGSRERSKEILDHAGKAVIQLRKRLSNDSNLAFSETLILTITSLMSVDLVARDVKKWKMHIDGLEQILAMRGGLDTLTPYVKHKVIGFQNFWLYKQMSISMEQQQVEYPRHPFSPELCASIAKMPNELSEMAMAGEINIALIKAMADVSAIAKRFTLSNEKPKEDLRRLKCLAYELEELHCLPITPLEQLIIAAACDYCMAIDDLRSAHWLLVGALQVTCSHLLFTGVEYDEKWYKVQIWSAAMLLATGEDQQQSFRLGNKILEACLKHHSLDRKYVVATCESIMWDDVFSNKLDENFDYDHLSEWQGSLSKSPESRIEK